MKSRSSGYSSDSEQTKQDLSLLRKPIATSLNGFLEAKRAFENGTEEIRRLLSYECDVIYECKVCHNLFRSLTNFLSHKRAYCREPYHYSTNFNSNNRNGFIDQDISTIIQAEEDYVNTKSPSVSVKEIANCRSSSSTPSLILEKTSQKNNISASEKPTKDLSSIIEKLVNRENENRLLKLKDFYDEVDNKLNKNENSKKTHCLQLNRVPNSNVAVYQTIIDTKNKNIATEIKEINDLLINDTSILGPDGKIVEKQNVQETIELKKEETAVEAENPKIQCNICNLKFYTEKMLILHLQTKHITSTFVYQCPSCWQTFLQPNSVIRHLSNDHKKSMRRIRQMRQTIYKRRVRLSEVQIRPPNRELARLQGNKDSSNTQHKAWPNESNDTARSLCNYCGKQFDRKAVLNSHLSICPLKNQVMVSSSIVNCQPTGISSSGVSHDEESGLKRADKNTNGFSLIQNFSNDPCIQGVRKPQTNRNRCKRRNMKLIKRENIFNSTEIEETLPPAFIEKVKIGSDTNQNDYCNNEEKKDENLVQINSQIIIKEDTFSNNDHITQVTDVSDNDIKPFFKTDDNQKTLSNVSNSSDDGTKSKNPLKKLSKRERFIKLIGCKGLNRKAEKDFSYECRICKKTFDALSNLRRHISMFHYRRRRFGCSICDYRAFRKYDVINHLSSFHAITSPTDEEIKDLILVTENKDQKDVDDDIIVTDISQLDITSLTTETNQVKRIKKKLKMFKASHDKNSIFIDSEHKDISNNIFNNEDMFERAFLANKSAEKKTNDIPNLPNISSSISVEDVSIESSRSLDDMNVPKKRKSIFTRSSLSHLNREDNFTPRRPIRNRIKPVNKDFVYDLSNLLKKDLVTGNEGVVSSPQQRSKRRNTINLADDNGREIFSLTSLRKPQTAFSFKGLDKQKIKGSAKLMAKLAVSMYRACFNTPPELPTERPIIPTKILPQGRVDDEDENKDILSNLNGTEETSFLFPNSAIKFKSFDEYKKVKHLRNIDDGNVGIVNKKRRLDVTTLNDDSPSTRLLRNMNAFGVASTAATCYTSTADYILNKKFPSIAANLNTVTSSQNDSVDDESTDKIIVKCPTDKEFQEYLVANRLSEPEKKTSINYDNNFLINGNSVESNLQQNKRVTLLQRLAENKNKKNKEATLRKF